MTTRALVLAGGGVAGIAWELGVLLGLRDGAPSLFPELLRPDLTLGTSAGAAVAGQLASALDLQQLYDRQLTDAHGEISVNFDLAAMVPLWSKVLDGSPPAQEARRRLGQLALDASSVSEAMRVEVIRQRLPSHEWPAHYLVLTAVDCENGDVVTFTKDSNVALVDAVAASCAVPLVWPPVTIRGRRYMDGGVASPSHIVLAAGYDRILVLTPSPMNAPSLLGGGLLEEIKQVGEDHVFVIEADEAAIAAFGINPLDPSTRRPSALAGRALGSARAEEFASFWA